MLLLQPLLVQSTVVAANAAVFQVPLPLGLHRAACTTADCRLPARVPPPARSTPLARKMRNGDETRHRWQVPLPRKWRTIIQRTPIWEPVSRSKLTGGDCTLPAGRGRSCRTPKRNLLLVHARDTAGQLRRRPRSTRAPHPACCSACISLGIRIPGSRTVVLDEVARRVGLGVPFLGWR